MNGTAWTQLTERLRNLGILEADLDEQFVRSGGKGGQNVNKVSTCAIIRHRPTGLVVRCEEERSQFLNRFLARKKLADKFETLARERRARERQASERIKRQKRRRNRTAKERMLRVKHHRAAVKKSRQSNNWDE